MKKYSGILALALIWGCNDRAAGPDLNNTSYGSSVIKLPAITGALASSSDVKYKFTLSITGDNMSPMTFSWPVDESGTIVTVDKIPAGQSRLFSGSLYGSDNSVYEGSAYANIFSGQVTSVTMILRKSGSAAIEVIIEDFETQNKFNGCFNLHGIVNKVDLSGYTLEIPNGTNKQFWGYIKLNSDIKGKFWGTYTEYNLNATISIPDLKIDGLIKGGLASDFTAFKSEVFSYQDSLQIGYVYGEKTSCDIPPPSNCIYDTLGGIGSTSCKDTATWIKYATEVCASQGRILSSYYFISQCEKKPIAYEGISFESCLPVK